MSQKPSKPSNWTDYQNLAEDSEKLFRLMRDRLIELLFSQDSTVAIRAAEMLNSTGSSIVEDDFAGVPTEQLQQARERAQRFIEDSNGLYEASSEAGSGEDDY